MILDPDEEVQAAVSDLFKAFAQTGVRLHLSGHLLAQYDAAAPERDRVGDLVAGFLPDLAPEYIVGDVPRLRAGITESDGSSSGCHNTPRTKPCWSATG